MGIDTPHAPFQADRPEVYHGIPGFRPYQGALFIKKCDATAIGLARFTQSLNPDLDALDTKPHCQTSRALVMDGFSRTFTRSVPWGLM